MGYLTLGLSILLCEVLMGTSFHGRVFGGVKAPNRVSFFVWTAAWGRILICDTLMRRGYSLIGWYCMCRGAGETVDHLLLHCNVASTLWSFIFRSFGIHWVIDGSVLVYCSVGRIGLECICRMCGIWFFCV